MSSLSSAEPSSNVQENVEIAFLCLLEEDAVERVLAIEPKKIDAKKLAVLARYHDHFSRLQVPGSEGTRHGRKRRANSTNDGPIDSAPKNVDQEKHLNKWGFITKLNSLETARPLVDLLGSFDLRTVYNCAIKRKTLSSIKSVAVGEKRAAIMRAFALTLHMLNAAEGARNTRKTRGRNAGAQQLAHLASLFAHVHLGDVVQATFGTLKDSDLLPGTASFHLTFTGLDEKTRVHITDMSRVVLPKRAEGRAPATGLEAIWQRAVRLCSFVDRWGTGALMVLGQTLAYSCIDYRWSLSGKAHDSAAQYLMLLGLKAKAGDYNGLGDEIRKYLNDHCSFTPAEELVDKSSKTEDSEEKDEEEEEEDEDNRGEDGGSSQGEGEGEDIDEDGAD